MKLSVQSRKAWQCNLTGNFWFNILTVWGQILVNIILSWIWNNNYITKTELAVSSTSSWENCLDYFNNTRFSQIRVGPTGLLTLGLVSVHCILSVTAVRHCPPGSSIFFTVCPAELQLYIGGQRLPCKAGLDWL